MSQLDDHTIADLQARVATLSKRVDLLKDDVRYAYRLMREMREGFTVWTKTGSWPDGFIETLGTVDRVMHLTANASPMARVDTIIQVNKPLEDDDVDSSY